MKFSEALAFCLYKIYNQLAIRDAPVFVLDLFLPILTTASWKESLRREMEGAKAFNTLEELLEDLRGTTLTSEKTHYTYADTSSNNSFWITCNFDCTSNNGLVIGYYNGDNST